MTLSVTNLGANPQQPSISAEAFIPDQLIAGALQLVTATVLLTGGVALSRGAVLGRTAVGTAIATPGTNTGNGAMGAITVGGAARGGNYVLKITKAAANAGDFELIDPEGDVVDVGSVAVAFSGGGLSFTLADGATDFAVGDTFNIAVNVSSEKFKLAALAAADGSSEPVAILADAADASGGDVNAPVYLLGEFNAAALTFGAGHTAASVKGPLRRLGIFLKDAVSAADPS